MTPLRPAGLVVHPLLVLALLAVPQAGALYVFDTIHGTATANRFYVESRPGWTVEGGLEKYNVACASCYVKINLTGGSLTVLTSTGDLLTLTSGAWEIRDFRGDFSWTQVRLGEHRLRIEGEGRLHPLASYAW